MKTVVIIGGGASGLLVAAKLLKKSAAITVTIVNRDHPFGRGIAYDTFQPEYLLNVPAARMSAFSERPAHFNEWLNADPEYREYHGSEFVPRMIYGRYLDLVFSDVLSSNRVRLIRASANNISFTGGKYSIELDPADQISADQVVLAMGNYLPSAPKGLNPVLNENDGYFRDPWGGKFLEKLPVKGSILLIGTGLTMVDCALALKHKGFKGKICISSPRGYIPAPNLKTGTYPDFYDELIHKDLAAIFRTVRKHIEKAASKGIEWQAVIDSLRPHVGRIWLQLSMKDKQQFISHVRHIWGVARHRLPPSVHGELMKLTGKGQAEIIAGRILSITKNDSGLEVTINLRKEQHERRISASLIVNCTGPQLNFLESDDPLIRNLVASGFIVPHELKMGIKASGEGMVIHRDGLVSKNVFAIGSLLRGVLWETTAIPEIRVQAENIAAMICAK